MPQGFRLAGVHCGIKRDADKLDLALIVSDRDAVAAGCYTTNLVHAAPVAMLELRHTRVSYGGVEELKRSLPNCSIDADYSFRR